MIKFIQFCNSSNFYEKVSSVDCGYYGVMYLNFWVTNCVFREINQEFDMVKLVKGHHKNYYSMSVPW